MIQRSEKERLLSDVLAEGESSAFRDGLLAEMLGQVRLRRRIANTGRAVVTLIVLGLLVFPFWARRFRASVSPTPARTSMAIVTTRPFPSANLVRTSRLDRSHVIESIVVTATITTKKGGGNVRIIGDGELFALIGPHPAVLVRGQIGAAHLVFVDPKDEYGFPIN